MLVTIWLVPPRRAAVLLKKQVQYVESRLSPELRVSLIIIIEAMLLANQSGFGGSYCNSVAILPVIGYLVMALPTLKWEKYLLTELLRLTLPNAPVPKILVCGDCNTRNPGSVRGRKGGGGGDEMLDELDSVNIRRWLLLIVRDTWRRA